MKKLMSLSVVSIVISASSAMASTSIDKLLAQQQVDHCQKSISTIAQQVVKTNKHRFHRPKADLDREQFSAIGVVEYRDRNSHLNITTNAQADGHCESTITETFVVPHPCITAREEVFKKWTFFGQLNAATMVLSSKKQPDKLAYLSNAIDGSICLITTKYSTR